MSRYPRGTANTAQKRLRNAESTKRTAIPSNLKRDIVRSAGLHQALKASLERACASIRSVLIWNLREFLDYPPAFVAMLAAILLALVLGIAFHEFCHAWAASELGDQTAARQGRLTLNPLVHIDPIGALMLVLIGFGWGRPTPVNPYNLRIGPAKGNALVALAGPVSNFFFAALAALPLRMGWVAARDPRDIANASGDEVVGLFLAMFVVFNLLLGIFNLIPVHPLDGFKVLVGIAPREVAMRLERLAPYGPGILFALIALSWVGPPQFNILGRVIGGLHGRVLDLLL